MAPFRLGIVTKLWRRPLVAGFVMAYLAALEVPGVELVPVAVASPRDPEEPEAVEGWRRVYAPNRPLSAKGNAAALELRDGPYGPVDAVLNVGSDDVVSPAYVAAAVEAVQAGADVVVPEGLALWDLVTDRCMTVDAPRIGAGRVLSDRLLDALDWKPWPVAGDGPGHDPDGDMDRRIADLAPDSHRAIVPGADIASALVVCDVKCGDNIGSYDAIEAKRGPNGQTAPVALADLLSALGIDAASAAELKRRHARHRYSQNLDPMNPDRLERSENFPVKVRATKTFTNRQEEGQVRRGQTFFATGRRAKALAKVGNVAILDGTPDGAPEQKEDKDARQRQTKPAGPSTTKAEAPPAAEVDVSEFHVGGGWYQIPGVEKKVQGEDAAREALAEVDEA